MHGNDMDVSYGLPVAVIRVTHVAEDSLASSNIPARRWP